MNTKLLTAIAGPAMLLGFVGQSWAESQPAPGTFAIEQLIVEDTCDIKQVNARLRGVFYYPGPNSLGATLRIAHNETTPNQFHWTIINHMPRTPAPGVIAWPGGFSGFVEPPGAPPNPFAGVQANSLTWVDASTFIMTSTATIWPLSCVIRSQFTAWRTNLNQAPLY